MSMDYPEKDIYILKEYLTLIVTFLKESKKRTQTPYLNDLYTLLKVYVPKWSSPMSTIGVITRTDF